MIDKTIIGLKKLGIIWIFDPCLSYTKSTSKKKMLTLCQRMLTLAYCGFLTKTVLKTAGLDLRIYPQKLKKKGYDNDKDQSK